MPDADIPDGEIPPVIHALIDATNRGDSDAFVATFTDDAHVDDWGREFDGHDGVRSWDSTDNVGVGMHFDLGAVDRLAPDRYDVHITAASRRFNGDGVLHVTIRDGLISRLET